MLIDGRFYSKPRLRFQHKFMSTPSSTQTEKKNGIFCSFFFGDDDDDRGRTSEEKKYIIRHRCELSLE